MISPDGYYIRPDGSQVHPLSLTSADLRNMSLSDYAVVRTYMSFGMPKPDDTTPMLPTHREIIDLTASEMGSGPVSKNNTYEKLPHETKAISKYQVTYNTYSYAKSSAEKKTYKDYYWEYVDATDSVKAAEAFHSMLDLVTEDMEPEQNDSWVKDKTVSVVQVKRTSWWRSPPKHPVLAYCLVPVPEIIYTIIHVVTGWSLL